MFLTFLNLTEFFKILRTFYENILSLKQIDDYVAKIESFLIFKEPQINFWHGKIGRFRQKP